MDAHGVQAIALDAVRTSKWNLFEFCTDWLNAIWNGKDELARAYEKVYTHWEIIERR